jgi:anthranilate phosphoribosyltransferase
MIPELLRKLALRESLSREEMIAAVGEVMEGRATPAQIGAFLMALRMKGETVEELTGAAEAMRARVTPVRAPAGRPLVDTCGTGGDASGSFNISTAAALVAAASGACVPKHGNRAVSSRAGSADVLEALGVPIDIPADAAERCLERHSFAFLFAPRYHPAMKHAAGPRRELGTRTMFNLLGPLCNPASVTTQVIGVFDRAWLEPLCEVLSNLGTKRALVVHGRDGSDEISIVADTDVCELREGRLRLYTVGPETAGLPRASRGDVAGGDAAENAGILRRILGAHTGPPRDVTLLNAAAALYVAGIAGDLRDGVALAARSIDEGAASALLEDVRRTLEEA